MEYQNNYNGDDNNNNQEDKKDEGKLTLSSYSGEYTYPNSGTFTVIENSGTISATSSNTDVATVVVNGNLVTVIPGTTEGTTNIKVISAETEKYNAKIVTYVAIVKKGTFSKESGIGYYADIDDDGTVDGIIFEDFRNGGSGTARRAGKRDGGLERKINGKRARHVDPAGFYRLRLHGRHQAGSL